MFWLPFSRHIAHVQKCTCTNLFLQLKVCSIWPSSVVYVPEPIGASLMVFCIKRTNNVCYDFIRMMLSSVSWLSQLLIQPFFKSVLALKAAFLLIFRSCRIHTSPAHIPYSKILISILLKHGFVWRIVKSYWRKAKRKACSEKLAKCCHNSKTNGIVCERMSCQQLAIFSKSWIPTGYRIPSRNDILWSARWPIKTELYVILGLETLGHICKYKQISWSVSNSFFHKLYPKGDKPIPFTEFPSEEAGKMIWSGK